jgi:hypothetical protein
MQNYREQIDFDTDSGELKVNGKAMMPFNKEYWLPSGEAGEPTIETIGNDGPDLSDTDALKYFREKLIKVSKIPLSRFDMESPPSWEMNAEGMTRDEIKFGRFVTRLRSVFQEILVKPLWIQMCLDFPEIKYFASEFLIQRFLGLSAEDLRLNKKLKQVEDEEKLEKAKKDAEATGM